ncbi:MULTISPECIES: hypothetical protein [unclassified Streptomyces]|nr:MULTISPECIES: hypothetical protein [unclassified Streptomyces]
MAVNPGEFLDTAVGEGAVVHPVDGARPPSAPLVADGTAHPS